MALRVEYSSQTDMVGKDLNGHIALAKTLALEYTDLEVISKSNKISLSNECIRVPFSFKAKRMNKKI